jgi:chorismate mutase
MPKAKNPISEQERSRRFQEEVRKRKEAGDFDQDAAENALDRLIKKNSKDLGV